MVSYIIPQPATHHTILTANIATSYPPFQPHCPLFALDTTTCTIREKTVDCEKYDEPPSSHAATKNALLPYFNIQSPTCSHVQYLMIRRRLGRRLHHQILLRNCLPLVWLDLFQVL